MRTETINLPYYPILTYEDICLKVKNIIGASELNDRMDVLLIVDDHTRPITGVQQAVLDYLLDIIGEERVAVLIASGLHRASSYQEIEDKLGINIKKVRLYSHNPMATPSSFLGEQYFRIGINTALPHLHTSHASCGKLICPGIQNYNDIVSFHQIPKSIAEISMNSHKIHFDIGIDVYINTNGRAVHIEKQDPIRNTFKKEYYTVDMPELTDVAVLIPTIKNSDFQQSMNAVNIFKYSSLVKPGGTVAISGDMWEGIGIHYLFQQPNGIKPVKYDEIFQLYFSGRMIAVVSEHVNNKAVQEYFNRKVHVFNSIFDFEKYVEFMYGKNVKANYFVGADIMIGRINEQPSV